MKIKFHTQRRDDELLIKISGDVITVNGDEYDFSPIGEGETLPHSAIALDTFIDDISRINGELEIGIIIPHKDKPAHAIAFPEDVVFTEGVLIDTVKGIYPWSLD